MTHRSKVRRDDLQMKGQRARTEEGMLRRVRDDKTAKHIEEQYGVKIPGRSDKQLKTLKEEYHVDSQTKLLEKLKSS